MSDKPTNQVAILQTQALTGQLRDNSREREALANANLTGRQTRELTKQLFRKTFEETKTRYEASLELQKYRLGADVELVKKKIDVEKDTIALTIREDFLNTLADLGMRVEMRQLDFLAEFGVQLKGFRQRLSLQDMDPDERDRILEMSRASFDRVFRRLTRIAGDFEQSASGA